jgi:hypothetical protein
MDFIRPSILTPRTLAVPLAIVASTLAGCSGSSSRELRTPGQSEGFVAEAASGEPYSDWNLTSNASLQATQAWAARAKIEDLGHKLRSALPLLPSSGPEPTWTCVMAHELVNLGTAGGTPHFEEDDVKIVIRNAREKGIAQNQITAMIHDASTIPFRDLAVATSVVCGPPF